MVTGMWLTARSTIRSGRSRTIAGSLPAVALAAFLASCTSPVFAPDGSAPPSPPDEPRPGDRIHQQAQDALVRWADAVRESGGASITFVGELTSQIGQWEAEHGDNKA